LIINIRKGKEKGGEKGPTDQKRSLMNPGMISFVPQGNIKVRDKGINTPPFTIHSTWVTAKRLKREK
jgi:hypothetical protein